jgi:hypothetical protein
MRDLPGDKDHPSLSRGASVMAASIKNIAASVHHRRRVPYHGEARYPEQPDEGLLRHLERSWAMVLIEDIWPL